MHSYSYSDFYIELSIVNKKSVDDCTIKLAYPIRSDFSLKLRE